MDTPIDGEQGFFSESFWSGMTPSERTFSASVSQLSGCRGSYVTRAHCVAQRSRVAEARSCTVQKLRSSTGSTCVLL